MGLRAAFRRRFLDVLASIYIFNEHRGYTWLDRVLEPSHWMPYAAWLQANGRGAKATWRERWTDYWIQVADAGGAARRVPKPEIATVDVMAR